MEIVERKISELKKAEYNPRNLTEKQRTDLRASLKTFGMVNPIIINKNRKRKDVIIGGHQRCDVWEELGHDTIPCFAIDLTLEQERELNIRLNKNGGEFNLDLLKEHFDQNELLNYGFEDFELGVFDEVDFEEEGEIELETQPKVYPVLFEFLTKADADTVKEFLEQGGTIEANLLALIKKESRHAKK